MGGLEAAHLKLPDMSEYAPRNYDLSLFVNPIPDSIISDALNPNKEGTSPPLQTVRIEGFSGKTWLLRYIEDYIKQFLNIPSVYLDLPAMVAPYTSGHLPLSETDRESVIAALKDRITDAAGVTAMQNRPLVLLADGTDQVDSALTAHIDREIFGPVVFPHPESRLVITSRPFGDTALFQNALTRIQRSLLGAQSGIRFSEYQVGMQLDKLNSPLDTGRVYELSGGDPGIVAMLAAHPDTDPNRILLLALQRMIGSTDTQISFPQSSTPPVRTLDAIAALSILNPRDTSDGTQLKQSLTDHSAAAFLNVFLGKNDLSYFDAGHLLRELSRQRLMRWDMHYKAWKMDALLAHTAETALKLTDPEAYDQLLRYGVDFFDSLAVNYPGGAQAYSALSHNFSDRRNRI